MFVSLACAGRLWPRVSASSLPPSRPPPRSRAPRPPPRPTGCLARWVWARRSSPRRSSPRRLPLRPSSLRLPRRRPAPRPSGSPRNKRRGSRRGRGRPGCRRAGGRRRGRPGRRRAGRRRGHAPGRAAHHRRRGRRLRWSVPLGRHHPGRLRLLRLHPVRLPKGRDLAAQDLRGPARRDHQNLAGGGPSRRPGLPGARPARAPRVDLRRRWHGLRGTAGRHPGGPQAAAGQGRDVIRPPRLTPRGRLRYG